MRNIISVAVVLLFAGSALAQSGQPIYPSYEGFAPNEDGTFTLAFGYYNPNTVPVEIAAGEANGFDPGPDDRGQTTLFLPGRHRNVCFVVLGEDSAGKNLRWRVESAGEIVATTERGGPDPLYLLEEIGAAYRLAQTIDTASAPRGVCVNTPPSVFASSSVSAQVGEPLLLRARVGDDGLPRGSSLRIGWSKVSGPGEVTFDSRQAASTSATFAAPGQYELQIEATDGAASQERTVVVTVTSP
ncbi:MAG: hypothetical protein VYE73_06510 [Acidobacteriota bacterium]|nr:hypothetical protein [Acidobacteriota bacterium]